LGYARVSTSGEDLTGQRLRLDRAGAIRIFETSALEGLWTDRVCKELHAIVLMSLEEMIDTSSAAGELVFHVFGAIAPFERRLIAERTKDGIAAAREGKATRTAADRSGKGEGDAEVGRGTAIANASCEASRPWPLDRLLSRDGAQQRSPSSMSEDT